ncbi:DUF2634 domain-containing protein [Paenibacillus sp. GXUN7292]|uniref:DUF2634 domain-containing protein n=1 Tax=Paenibacillus sp. GXUN7292 TaxID=3422499 RepID=UPI003D7D5EDC
MIPSHSPMEESDRQGVMPSLTWRLDLDKGRIVGKIDALEAVKQAVFKILQTDRYGHDIYSFDYGHELKQLLGGSPAVMESEVNRMIREALLQDDRIVSVEEAEVTAEGNSLLIRCVVVTDYGSFEVEVNRDV